MPHPRARDLQCAVDQFIGRLANKELDCLPIGDQSSDHLELLEKAMCASVACSISVEEPTEQWRQRQGRRLGPRYSEMLDTAISRFEASDKASPDQWVNGLATRGVPGLSDQIDDLSLDEWTDVPSLQPVHPISVWAGISQITTTPKLTETFPTVLYCDTDVEIALPSTQRGAHMSRLQTALLEVERQTFDDLDSYTLCLANQISAEQPQAGVRIRCDAAARFPISTRKTKRESYVKGRAKLELTLEKEGDIKEAVRGLEVDIATACPCTLRYSRLLGMRSLGLESDQALPPTFTHSQPGTLYVSVTDQLGYPEISYAEIFYACARAAHLREAVLKRPDEHDLVERIHRRPQFAEDVTRAVAAEVAACLDQGHIDVSAHLDESIHPHQAKAVCAGAVETFWCNQ